MAEEFKSYFIKDSANLFMDGEKCCAVMPVLRWKAMSDALLAISHGPNKDKLKSEIQEARAFLALIKTLPKDKSSWDIDEFDDKNHELKNSSPFIEENYWEGGKGSMSRRAKGDHGFGCLGDVKCFVWHAPGNFKSATVSFNLEYIELNGIDELRASWELMSSLWDRKENLNKALENLGFPKFNPEEFKRAKGLSERMKTWSFEEDTPEAAVLKNEAWALWDGEENGFLQKGSAPARAGPLSMAMLYDTEKQAEKGAKSRGMEEAFAVKCSIGILEAKPLGKAKTMGALALGLAKAQEKALAEDLGQRELAAAAERKAKESGQPAPKRRI